MNISIVAAAKNAHLSDGISHKSPTQFQQSYTRIVWLLDIMSVLRLVCTPHPQHAITLRASFTAFTRVCRLFNHHITGSQPCLLDMCLISVRHKLCTQIMQYQNYQSWKKPARTSAVTWPASPANGPVNYRKWQISTPTESTPLSRSQRNLLQVIMSATPTSVPNFAQIRPPAANFAQMAEI